MNNKNKKCLIVGHLSCSDLLTINGLTRYYTDIYNYVYVLCKKKNYKTFNQVYSDNNSIIPIFIDIEDNIISNDHYIFDLYSNIDIIRLGSLNNNWYVLKSDYLLDNIPYSFFKTFYKQCDLDYKIRYKYEKINRNHIYEKHFYNNVMLKYNKYIFLHDVKNEIILDNSEYQIFHPNKNYYKDNSQYYNLWNGLISDNLLDYSYILENALEIHVTYSSFFALCMFLNLEKVKKKNIYTKIANIKDYHINLNNWNIIYI